MDTLSSVWLIGLFFILRLAVPLLITVGIAVGLKRLDARWQAEARQRRLAQPAVQPMAAGQPLMLHSNGQQPFQPILAGGGSALPCWMVKGCSETLRATCAAWHQPATPCWQARLSAEGRLPAECQGCERYLPAPSALKRPAMVH